MPFERKRKVDVPAARAPHRPAESKGSDPIKLDNIQVNNKGGTSADATVARLKRDRPDLVERIETGELSPIAGTPVALSAIVVYSRGYFALSDGGISCAT